MRFNNQKKEFVPIPTDMWNKIPDMGLSTQVLKVWMEILRMTIGYEESRVGGESVRSTKRPLSPKYVEKSTLVPRRSVIRAYQRLEEQRMIRKTKTLYKDKLGRDQLTTTVEVNLDTSQWISREQMKKRGNKVIPNQNKILFCRNLIFNNEYLLYLSFIDTF